MAPTRKWSSNSEAAAPSAAGRKRMQQLDPNNICTYWPANPAFDPKRVLLHRLFFINEDRKNTCLSVSIPLATIHHWWNLGSFGGAICPRPSSSAIITSKRWVWDCPNCATPCVDGSLLVAAGVTAVPSTESDEKPPDGKTIWSL